MIKLRGLPRSATNVVEVVLRERYGLKFTTEQRKQKHERTCDLSHGDALLVVYKHPYAWFDSVWRAGVVWPWMTMVADESVVNVTQWDLSFEEFVLKRGVAEAFDQYMRGWLSHENNASAISHEQLLVGPAVLDDIMATHDVEPTQNAWLPEQQVTWFGHKSRQNFDRAYYEDEMWRDLVTPAVEEHARAHISATLCAELGVEL